MDTLAPTGSQYTNFHSGIARRPARRSTGRNNHSVGMKELAGLDRGYSHARGRVGGPLPRLRAQGYSTLAAGKWHLVPQSEIKPSGDGATGRFL